MRLSLCIPTHDGRAGVLRETLNGVLEQAAGDLKGRLQICISDNASADGTEEMVAQYSRAHPGLFVYSRSPTNQGFLGNLLRVTALAGGDFCWLLSSDDQIAQGGLARVMQTLEERPETSGLTVFTEGFDRDMAARSVHQNNPVILPEQAGRMHVYETEDEIFHNCGLFHGCFSAQIVSRSRWNDALDALGRERLAQNVHFPHLLLIGLMVKKNPHWIWLPELTVKARRDNDALTSQLGQNLFRYQLETMRDLSQAWATLLGRRSPLYQDLMARAHTDQWNGGAICALKIRSRCGPGDDWAVLVGYTRHLYFLPEYRRSSLPFALIPAFALRLGSRMRLGPRLRALQSRRKGGAARGGAL